MKIVCSKENLIDAINTVQKAVSTKTTNPLLECILLKVEENFILTAYDQEIGIEKTVPAVIFDAGCVALNAKVFGDIVRRLPDADVSIELKENQTVFIECGPTNTQLKGFEGHAFPTIEDVVGENVFSVRQGVIKEMIRQTIFAVGVDDFRPILTGTLIQSENGILSFVSIDGMRIALRNWTSKETAADFKVIVPGKTLNEIGKILLPSEEEVKIVASKNQIMFQFDGCKIVSRLIEGEFFNYKTSIPTTFATTITVDKKFLLASIELASTITMNEKRYHVKFSIAKEKLTVFAKTDLGEIKEEIDVSVDGNDLEVGFNPRYFADALKVIDDEKILIKFTSTVGPCIISPLDEDDFMYLILPLRIKSEA
ncbi:MAG: DNA polymerase III subunit beta [Bacillota bacterium]